MGCRMGELCRLGVAKILWLELGGHVNGGGGEGKNASSREREERECVAGEGGFAWRGRRKGEISCRVITKIPLLISFFLSQADSAYSIPLIYFIPS